MKRYSYFPPKLKPSAKRIEVTDEDGNVVCTFQRVYSNAIARVCNYVFDIDWSARVNVYSADGQPVIQCQKKTPWFGKPEYVVQYCNTQDTCHVTYKTWQKLAPEFKITHRNQEYVMKKDILDWAKFLHEGVELARWKTKPREWFKAELEIEDACPIQEPEFFVALFHCIFYIGD